MEYILYMCVHGEYEQVWPCICQGTKVEVRGDLWELTLSFPFICMGSVTHTWVIGSSDKMLAHLMGASKVFLKLNRKLMQY